MNNRKMIILVFVMLITVIGLVAPKTTPAYTDTPQAQELLQQIAQHTPKAEVEVIVQKADKTSLVENSVILLGGTITRQLFIINAFVARMTASSAVELANNPAVRWVSLDAPMIKSGGSDGTVDSSKLINAYNRSIRADKVWEQGYQGSSITVAVVDSGINWMSDLYTIEGQNRVIANTRFNDDYNPTTFDQFSHGSTVAGVAGGNGRDSSGAYIGVAPKVKIVNVKVSNDDGSAKASKVVEGLQWILQNKDTYNIRVVNLSLNSSVAESYNTSPICAAVEILWFNKIVVVTAAGNNGTAKLYPPANDPFVITVGAVDDKGTASISDDVMASFSAYGVTADKFKKPDLVAPGKNIVSLMGNGGGTLPSLHPDNKVANSYFRMSGTSVSAPMVTGAVALLLQANPSLTPDQVKYRLMNTANKNWAGYNAGKSGAGYLDVYAAVTGTSTQNANTGITASRLLTTGSAPVNSSVSWNSVSWNSVSWNSVSWNSVSWNSVSWNSVSWNSDYWGQ